MNTIKKIVLVLIALFPFVCLADSNCDFKTKSEYSKLAKNVTASYDIVEDGGTKYISIKIYNIVEGIQLSYTAGTTSKNSKSAEIYGFVASHDTIDGVYEIKHYNISDIYKYKFTVNASASCSGSLKSFTLTIPKYNKYSELAECQYFDVTDYLYCQKWITSNFDYNEPTIISKINKYRESKNKSTTTQSYENIDSDSDKKYEWLVRLRLLIIIGLTIGIIADIVYIVLFIPKLKDYMRFDIDF